MNILVLAPYPPFPPHGGGTMRIYQIIRGLSERHTVTCLSFVPDAAAEVALAPLQHFCRVVMVRGPLPRSALRRAWTTLSSPLPDMALRNAAPAYAVALQTLLTAEQFDLIQAESIEMAGYLLPLKAQAILVLDQFNAEFLLQRRAFLTDVRQLRRWHAAAYSLMQWAKLARYEARMLRVCDAVLAVAKEDRQTLLGLAPAARIGVVPNGVDTAHFSRSALVEQRAGPFSFKSSTLVFSGTLDFRPNIDAVTWFVREVLPLIRMQQPDVRLVVVGKRPAPALTRLAIAGEILLTGEVPDARPYIADATVYIVPMRIGGGVRLKLLEALSLQAPVVSTTMGAEGVSGLRADEHCLLADDPVDFAGAVLRLLADPALGQRMGAAGRALVRTHYDWTTIVPQLEALYAQIAL